MFFEVPSWDVSKEATELNDSLFNAKPNLSNKKKSCKLKTTNGQSFPNFGKQIEMLEGIPKVKVKGNVAEHLIGASDANTSGLKKTNKRNKYLNFGKSSKTISAQKTEIRNELNPNEEVSPHANANMVKYVNETKDNSLNLSSKKKRKLKLSLIENESFENDQESSRSSKASPVKKRKVLSEEICQKAAKDVQKKNDVNITSREITSQDYENSSVVVSDNITGVTEKTSNKRKKKKKSASEKKKSVQNKTDNTVDNGSQTLLEEPVSSSKKENKLNCEKKKETMLTGEKDGNACTVKGGEKKKLKKSKLKDNVVVQETDDGLCASPIVNATNGNRNKQDTSQNSVLKRETDSRNTQIKRAKQQKVQADSGTENKTNHGSNSLPFTPKKISQMLAKMQKTPKPDAGQIGKKAHRKVRMEISPTNEAQMKNKKLQKVHSHTSEVNMNPEKNSKTITQKGGSQKKSLLQKNLEKLEGARFRFINEQLYVRTGEEAFQLFKEDPYAFEVYHKGFQNQVDKWPVNPLDVIIDYIKSKPPNKVIADFGCGDARLAQSVPNKVHSFDLVAVNNQVTVCDISNVPLSNETIDTAVFCLSLMGTNFTEYLTEANRVLKKGGVLMIAEVASRFRKVNEFVYNVEKMGFTSIEQDTENTMFVLMKFQKKANLKSEVVKKMTLKPCMYKKR